VCAPPIFQPGVQLLSAVLAARLCVQLSGGVKNSVDSPVHHHGMNVSHGNSR
jgi:hypothetical protein